MRLYKVYWQAGCLETSAWRADEAHVFLGSSGLFGGTANMIYADLVDAICSLLTNVTVQLLP